MAFAGEEKDCEPESGLGCRRGVFGIRLLTSAQDLLKVGLGRLAF